MSPRLVFLSFAIASVWSVNSSAETYNDSTAPWDYRNPRYADNLELVDVYHFNLDVQMLVSGQTAEYPGPDLEFMLRYFPNHHGALDVMGKLWRRHRNKVDIIPRGLTLEKDADYYFERAIEFAADDGVVRMLYGTHLFLGGRYDLALQEYEVALELDPESPEVHYNVGLFFVATENYEKASKHATVAYTNGYPLPGLRNKLVRAGVWDADAGTGDVSAVTKSYDN